MRRPNRVTGSLAIVFAQLLIQYGARNCKKDYWTRTSLAFDITGKSSKKNTDMLKPDCMSQYDVRDGHFLKERVPTIVFFFIQYGSVSGKVYAMKHGHVRK